MFQVRNFPGVASEEVQQVGLQDLPGEADNQAGVQQVGHANPQLNTCLCE